MAGISCVRNGQSIRTTIQGVDAIGVRWHEPLHPIRLPLSAAVLLAADSVATVPLSALQLGHGRVDGRTGFGPRTKTPVRPSNLPFPRCMAFEYGQPWLNDLAAERIAPGGAHKSAPGLVFGPAWFN
jgi:hypothetical protein